MDNPSTLISLRNRCFMRLLERIARRFNEAGVPLMALKGAALNLLIEGIDVRRPMSDLDLLVRSADLDRARELLEELGCLRGQEHVREDFVPRFHYEIEYTAQAVYPMKIDLHVRPFRPLRYSQLVPEDALWRNAREIAIGEARVGVPSTEDMLLHLAVHAAVHGFASAKWLTDIREWIAASGAKLNWDELVSSAVEWGLSLPLRTALRRAAQSADFAMPTEPLRRLAASSVGWRDHLALWQAPRDAAHPVAHVLVNLLCTPGWRFKLAYFRAVLIPDSAHMAEWYCRRHWAWQPCAHLLRWSWPAVRHLPRLWTWFNRIETRPCRVGGVGVFAACNLKINEVIARCHRRAVNRVVADEAEPAFREAADRTVKLTGKLRHLHHSCNPNAQLLRSTLVAIRPIRSGDEITIDYGGDYCQCRGSDSRVMRPRGITRREQAA